MENILRTQKSYRYYVEGNPETAKHLVFVLHGYGQLSKFFIRKFKDLVNEETAIIAPEGMHRFYLKGSSGRVGASWMTKEAREDDIADNIQFLNEVFRNIEPNTDQKRTLLGFSQGGATAARWHQLGEVNFDNFVLWASVFPPDLKGIESDSAFMHSNNFFVVGDQDEFLDEERIHAAEKDFADKHLNFTFIRFEGDHNIYPSPLNELNSQL
ncbi:Predicted esterase [Lishizhenia tianjinensis]|uniref:Predicted esterase n=1 Tax=Lishizhenia tianjinensis TaxID=477690 RepID=A0A1I6YVZ3_9FLAO|nr:alpha/beta hydrolase [Lishizhenia tianjinensis]SFT54391.1 Predicted esterase [Lishizhenia tianjinensis]